MTGAGDIQAVTFGLDSEVFGVPVMIVREILDHAPPFRVPNGPDWLLGLTDVRGQGVPTIDLRTRLNLPRVATTPATRILILDVPRDDRVLTLGVVVDRVLNVATIAGDRVEPLPEIGIRWRSDHIAGVVRQPEGFLLLLNVASIFSDDDIAVPAELSEAA